MPLGNFITYAKWDVLFYSLEEGMRMNDLEESNNITFESIKHINEEGIVKI